MTVVLRLDRVTRVHGAGETAVHALRGISLDVRVDVPAPVTWSQVLVLNDAGFAAFSRTVLTDPPPRAEVPLYATPGYAEGSRFGLAQLVAAVRRIAPPPTSSTCAASRTGRAARPSAATSRSSHHRRTAAPQKHSPTAAR